MAKKSKKQLVIPESIEIQDEYHALIATWILQILLSSAPAFRDFFIYKQGYCDSDLQEFIQCPAEDANKITIAEMKQYLQRLLVLYQQSIDKSAMLFTNISLMNRHINLSEIQQQILALVVLKERSRPLQKYFEQLHMPYESQLYFSLANILSVDARHIAKAMAGSAPLRASGLISMNINRRSGLSLEPMDGLCEALMSVNENEQELLSHFLAQAKAATLDITDYPHVREDFEILQSILDTSLEQREKGVNILIYGISGSGKTELARLLAKTTGANLFEVKTEDDDGDPIVSCRRMEGYRFCQQMLSDGSKNLILFDEVEDVFPASGFALLGMEIGSGKNKGWVNKTLEENRTPAIWICNRINQIDPAFLRRFDYAMELNTPPRSIRLNIIRSRLANMLVSDSFMMRMSEHEKLSPAQVARAAKVLERIAHKDQKAAENVLEKILGNSAKAMGQKPLARQQAHATHYSLDYLNANIDLPGLVDGLQRSKRGNICFYGAPGTGKTALAGYIAKQLDKPLLSKRASDILSMWVGESEQNISRMFEQARLEDAVLVLDEADSLLRDRRGANQSWEVTQVNELLVQMENFDGLFICSTNLMDNLDQASLRRFAIKVEFDYLKPDQACKMLQQECIGKITGRDRQAISMMINLTPGDFSAVKKRLEILGLDARPEVLIRELRDELTVKDGRKRTQIGFISK